MTDTTRLDVIIQCFETKGVAEFRLDDDDAAYLARVLRAGQELRENSQEALYLLDEEFYDQSQEYKDLKRSCTLYDSAVGGADDPAQTPD